MKQISLEEALSEDRHYVINNAKAYDIFKRNENSSLTAYLHDSATNTCFEKLSLLREEFPQEGWRKERVVKALYAVVGSEWKPYLFVMPEMGYNVKWRKNISGGSRRKKRKLSQAGKLTNEIVSSIFSRSGITQKILRYDPYIGEDAIPENMEQGTCTPFISWEEAKKISYFGKLEKIFVHDMPEINEEIVDISVGGKGEMAKKMSLHLPYSLIYSILNGWCFGKVTKIDFFKE